MVPLFVCFTIGGVDERQSTVGTLLAVGLGLMFEKMPVVRLGLSPPLGHKLDREHLQAVQTQDVLRTVVFLKSN